MDAPSLDAMRDRYLLLKSAEFAKLATSGIGPLATSDDLKQTPSIKVAAPFELADAKGKPSRNRLRHQRLAARTQIASAKVSGLQHKAPCIPARSETPHADPRRLERAALGSGTLLLRILGFRVRPSRLRHARNSR